MSESTNGAAASAKQQALTATKPRTNNLANLSQIDMVKQLQYLIPSMKAALPKHITPERMLQMVTTLCKRNPRLAECTTSSIVGAMMQASILGFRPVDVLGECYFVPYQNKGVMEAQFQIGYRGYLTLARNSEQIKSIYAEVVCKTDKFEYELGLTPKLFHKPDIDADRSNPANITHVYAVAHFVNGGNAMVLLTKKQIETLRTRNAMQSTGIKGAWKTDYDAMAKAKALKQLAKFLPLTDKAMTAVATDEMTLKPENFENGEVVEETITYPEAEDAKYSETPQEAQKPAATNEAEESAFTNEDLQDMRDQIKDCKSLEELDRIENETNEQLVAAVAEEITRKRIELKNPSRSTSRKVHAQRDDS